MTLTSALTLLATLLVLALMPGPGMFLVVTRTWVGGFGHGVCTAFGIVAADFVFITLALLGLSALSGLMGGFFMVIKYLGAGYLVWLGISVAFPGFFARNQADKLQNSQQYTARQNASHLASFALGLLTTLGNPKAILFYLSILPVFFDAGQASMLGAAVLYAIATIAVGGVMLAYAYAAHRAKDSLHPAYKSPVLRFGCGAVLVGSGLFVAFSN